MSGALTLVSLIWAVIAGYLLVLTIAAMTWRRRPPLTAAATRTRFAVCVPAHDEESRLPRLLASLRSQTYDAARFDVHVVADNCTDRTAAVARANGATTHERADLAARGKGHALAWLLERLSADLPNAYDAFVIVDADSVLDANFLAAMSGRLASGAVAVQAYYAVLDPLSSRLAALRAAALAAIHYVRPLGRSRLGLSAGLKGNGMCFTAGLIARTGWRWFTLAEDVEFHLHLVSDGVVVVFAPETTVHGEMPSTFAQAATQNARWERGRIHTVRRLVPGLLADGVRLRSVARIDAAIEQLIPPLSFPLAGAICTAAIALGTGAYAAALVSTLAGAALAAHVLAAMIVTRAPVRAYVAFLLVPSYVAWKVAIYLRALLPTRERAWLRTPRT